MKRVMVRKKPQQATNRYDGQPVESALIAEGGNRTPTQSDVFAALGHPARLRLLDRMRRQVAPSISELSEGAGISRQAITGHLKLLEDAGLIRKTSVGRERRYRIIHDRFHTASKLLAEIATQWDEALGRLKFHVEED